MRRHLRAVPDRPAPLVRVSGLGDLAAVVPYLIGFTPHESLTCVGMAAAPDGGSARRVGLTARVDLAAVLDAGAAPLVLDGVFGGMVRAEAAGVIALVSSAADTVDPAVVERLETAAARAGIELLDVGWDRGEVVVPLACDDPVCCPPEGQPIDRASAAVASATFAGVVVLPDREAVEAEFAVADRSGAALGTLIEACETAAVRALVAGEGARRTAEASARVLELARERDARPPGPAPAMSDRTVAQCVTDLADVGVRDAVWLAIDSGEVHGQGLWLELARRAPSPYDASPLFLLGWRSWRHGDGVRATIAAERAAATPGGYSAARLLLDAIGACVDPRTVPPLSA